MYGDGVPPSIRESVNHWRKSLSFPPGWLGIMWLIAGAATGGYWLGCASIHPPDGGPRDLYPPTLRKVSASYKRGSYRLRLRWNEYLSPASELSGTGVWLNPTKFSPSQIRLRGKTLSLRIEGVPPGACFTLWGGRGIKDFTEGNPLPPRLLWSSCPLETLATTYVLSPPPSPKAPLWAELSTDSVAYRFLGWEGSLSVSHLPPGKYHGWAWEDADGDGKWSLLEPLWLPDTFLEWPPALSADSASSPPCPWTRWHADTTPPILSRPAQRDTTWRLFTFNEPVFLLSLIGEGRQLSEKALLLRSGAIIELADSAGNHRRDTLPEQGLDTQAYKPTLFWPAQANLHCPEIYLTLPESLPLTDTFWTTRVADTLYIGQASWEGVEIYLSPLPITRPTVPLAWILSTGDTLQVQVPPRKYATILPEDSTGLIQRWRIYGPPVLGAAWVAEASPGTTVWLPPGSYSLIGLGGEGPFWQPLSLKGSLPTLQKPPLRKETLVVPLPTP